VLTAQLEILLLTCLLTYLIMSVR